MQITNVRPGAGQLEDREDARRRVSQKTAAKKVQVQEILSRIQVDA